MKNHNKHGYSVPEIAQVFGCVPQTLRKWVDEGKIRCLVGPVGSGPNHGRSMRFEREHVQEYMRQNAGKFDEATLKAWGVNSMEDSGSQKAEAKAPETTLSYITGDIKAPDHVRKAPIGSINPNDCPTRPTGAWADLIKPKRAETGVESATEAVPISTPALTPVALPKEIEATYYSVLVNGRIAVAGITKDTALAIVTALLNDTGKAQFNDVSIQKVRKV